MRLFSDCPSNNFLQLFHHKYAGADRSATGINGKTYARDLVGTRRAEIRTRKRVRKASHKGDFHVQNGPQNECCNESIFLGYKSVLL